MAKSNQKKDKILYGLIIGLVVIIVFMFNYFQKKIDSLEESADVGVKVSMAINKRLNNVIQLNYLNTDNQKYLINPIDWKETLEWETALNLSDLENYQVDKVIVRQYNEIGENDLSEFTIIINIPGDSSFNDFTNIMYQKINEIFVKTNNDTSKVESFKEGRGYYDIESFEEATYNNMYYDYMKPMSDGSTGGPKVKVKILYLEETNQIKMEINKF